jgi:hypothetical protein
LKAFVVLVSWLVYVELLIGCKIEQLQGTDTPRSRHSRLFLNQQVLEAYFLLSASMPAHMNDMLGEINIFSAKIHFSETVLKGLI